MTVDAKELANAAKAALAAGQPDLALELVEDARKEILGSVWLAARTTTGRWDNLSPKDQELVLRAIENGSEPASLLVRSIAAVSQVRELDHWTDRWAFEYLMKARDGKLPKRLRVYDSADLSLGSPKLLSNHSQIGVEKFTNVKISGRLTYDAPCFVTSIRVSAPIAANISFGTYSNSRKFEARADDLYSHPARLLIPVSINENHELRVDLDDNFVHGQPRFYVYIEGWEASDAH